MEATRMAASQPPEFSRCGDPPGSLAGEVRIDRQEARAAASMKDKVERALWKVNVLRSSDYWNIEVAVRDGCVYLSGHVISTGNQARAESAARTVAGVGEVTNLLVSDEQLIREVAGALGKIEHEHGVKFFTGVGNGVVMLSGDVNSPEVRSLAIECAANIPGVRGVLDSVRCCPEGAVQASDQRFVQPVIGAQAYFRGGTSGVVRSVIIDPSSRLVVAMVVAGRFSSTPKAFQSFQYNDDRSPDRLIVLPASVINNLTDSATFLLIDSAEASSYSNFDPSGFRVPGEDWTPPFPYCVQDILFPVEPVAGATLPEPVQHAAPGAVFQNASPPLMGKPGI